MAKATTKTKSEKPKVEKIEDASELTGILPSSDTVVFLHGEELGVLIHENETAVEVRRADGTTAFYEKRLVDIN